MRLVADDVSVQWLLSAIRQSHQGLAGEGAAGHMSSPLQVFMAATSAWSNWWAG